jgi:hypothetical protein
MPVKSAQKTNVRSEVADDRRGRGAIAIAAGILTLVVVLAVGHPVFVMPFHLVVLLGLSIAAATIGAFVYDPTFGSKSELIFTLGGFAAITLINLTNFSQGDQLIAGKFQILLDAIQVLFAFAIILILARWRPSRDLLKGIRILALYCVSAFGLMLPLLYGTVATLFELGMTGLMGPRLGDWIGILSFILGVPATVLALAGERSPSA